MPRPQPHPLALFSLTATNQRAHDVITHPINDHLASTLSDGNLALDIGHVISTSGDGMTLATLGRNADIFVPGTTISKVQCSFEIDPVTNIIMFYDRSHNRSTQVSGKNAKPFEYGRPRKVVVSNVTNTIIGMGGQKRDLVCFKLIWHYDTIRAMEKVKDRQSGALEENRHLARTIDEADTSAPTRMETRIHTTGPQQPQLRYTSLETLGRGISGSVKKVVDVDTGRLMALKLLKRPSGLAEQMKLSRALKREVETLSRLSHPHIVEYIAFQDVDEPDSVGFQGADDHYSIVSKGKEKYHSITSQGDDESESTASQDEDEAMSFKLFMGLNQGTLMSLVEHDDISVDKNQLCQHVLHQMLKAIDFLATQDVIHRDIKPENILYDIRSSNYCFQLGDFGLSSSPSIALTVAGSLLYMAPEVLQGGRQTHKIDVWSLFVTILWTLDTTGFRQLSAECRTIQDAHHAILSSVAGVSVIEEMARVNSEERASAAQMLIKCFNGEGLSTPQHQVPALEYTQASTSTQYTATPPPLQAMEYTQASTSTQRTTTPPPLLAPRTRYMGLRRRRAPPQDRCRVGKPRRHERQPGSLAPPPLATRWTDLQILRSSNAPIFANRFQST
ncbi:hypothetical protein E0Z10_g5 [Xylaria hypoxylon]|uniref:non-specific serine/threonine protein kinase n=1 Tax=Xylaria hypoxylon TaxID=37992 RepID=A0A4Z0YXJ5_9PEZI|nr:hypothetical protein E0Z10_g5 [Xylaria hypoxylon]